MWVLNNTVERAQGLGLYRSEFKSQLRLCLTGKPFSLSETYKQFLDLQNELHTTYFGLLCRLQTMHKEKVWKNVLVAELCLTPWDPMGCSPPGFSVHVILQARILDWVAISFSSDEVWSERSEWSEVAQSCPTLCDPMDCSPPDSAVHGIFQARVLGWVAIIFSIIWLTSY